jgi:hypothetical protein
LFAVRGPNKAMIADIIWNEQMRMNKGSIEFLKIVVMPAPTIIRPMPPPK